MNATILFLCPHGAAKSIMAAAYFRRLAEQHGIHVEATSAGTDPAAEVSPSVAEFLAKEGIDVYATIPQRVTHNQIVSASRVISIGCERASLPPSDTVIEHWDDVPPPSEDLVAARNSIYEHVAQLVEEYK